MRSEYPLNLAEEIGIRTCLERIGKIRHDLHLAETALREALDGVAISKGVNLSDVGDMGITGGGKVLVVEFSEGEE